MDLFRKSGKPNRMDDIPLVGMTKVSSENSKTSTELIAATCVYDDASMEKQFSSPTKELSCSSQGDIQTPCPRIHVGFRLGKRRILSERRRFVSNCSLCVAVFGVAIMVIETELTMAHVYNKDSIASLLLKTSVSVSTLLLLLLILAYYRIQAQLYTVDNCIDDWKTAGSWSVCVQITIELVICSIHPFPGNAHFIWTTVRTDGVTSSQPVSIDLFFSFPMFLRFYLVGRVMLLQSRVLSDASSLSIGALNRINFNVRFVLKTLMTICPGTVLVVFMLTVWILASWTLRICESTHDSNHRNLLNSLWMIAVTFLSVGYGDIVPNTYCGRSIAVLTGIMGSGCTALVVAVPARKIELTRAERHVHNFMIDCQLSKRHLTHSALNSSHTVYSSQPPAIYKQVQTQLSQAILDLCSRQADAEKRTDSIESNIKWLQIQLDALPNLVVEQLQKNNNNRSLDDNS